MRLTVGRVARAHGIRGEVCVEVRTDDPDARLAPGATLATDPESSGPLEVVTSRWHSGRLLVHFGGVRDRTAAERLRGTGLLVDVAADQRPEDPDEFYDHQLVGLRAVTRAGADVGQVVDVLHLPGQEVLALLGPDGCEVLVPFVAEIVPEVDLVANRIVLDAPPGLLADHDRAGEEGPAR